MLARRTNSTHQVARLASLFRRFESSMVGRTAIVPTRRIVPIRIAPSTIPRTHTSWAWTPVVADICEIIAVIVAFYGRCVGTSAVNPHALYCLSFNSLHAMVDREIIEKGCCNMSPRRTSLKGSSLSGAAFAS